MPSPEERHKALLLSWLIQAKNAAAHPQVKEATQHLEAFHRDLQQQLHHHVAESERAQQFQEKLVANVANGTITPQNANDENRALQQLREHHHQQAQELGRLLNAQAPQDLCGFIDLPLEYYPHEIQNAVAQQSPLPEKQSPPAKKRLSPTDRVAILLGLVTIVVAAALIYRNHYQGEGVQFSLQTPRTHYPRATLTCKNATYHPITLYLTENAPDAFDKPDQAYRIDLSVVQNAEDPFKLFPHTADHWYANGIPLAQSGPITLPPGITATLKLDIPTLRAQLNPSAKFQIDCRVGNNTIAFSDSF